MFSIKKRANCHNAKTKPTSKDTKILSLKNLIDISRLCTEISLSWLEERKRL